MKPLLFGADIHLVDSLTLKELKLQHCTTPQVAGPPWGLELRVKLQETGYTNSAYDCSIINIENNAITSLSHLVPTENKPAEIEHELNADLAELQKEDKAVSGLIAGGFAYPGLELNPSFNIFYTIFIHLDALNVPFSFIWGRRSENMQGATGLLCLPKLKQYFLCLRRMWYYNQPDCKTLQDLKETCRFIGIKEGDSLITADQTIKGPWLLDWRA